MRLTAAAKSRLIDQEEHDATGHRQLTTSGPASFISLSLSRWHHRPAFELSARKTALIVYMLVGCIRLFLAAV